MSAADVNNISLFVTTKGKRKEFHDLNRQSAYAFALTCLYHNGKLIPKVTLEMRSPYDVIFTANNP